MRSLVQIKISKTVYPDYWRSVTPGKRRDRTSNMLQTFPSTSFPIHYSQIAPLLDVMQSTTLKALLSSH